MTVADEALDHELAFFNAELAKAGGPGSKPGIAALGDTDAKVARLVRTVARLMYVTNISDMHIEPVLNGNERSLRVRVRETGGLREMHRIPFAFHEPITQEWKRLAGLAADDKLAGRGVARFTFDNQLCAFHVTVAPTFHGDVIVIRLIPTRIPTLAQLGCSNSAISEWITRPAGLVLFTGPTGSGKSTTMAACVASRIDERVNITVIEPEIAYLYPEGVTQLDVKASGVAAAVQSAMDLDVDVLVLSEMPQNPALDRDVAQRIVWAAETGHLVLALMHARDTASALYEFVDAGVKRSLLADTLNGIVTQYLVRALCPACKLPRAVSLELLDDIRTRATRDGFALSDAHEFYGPVGCEQCDNKGYVRKVAIHETFEFTPSLKAAFVGGASLPEFRRVLEEHKHGSSFAAGMRLAVEGVTSPEEVVRGVGERGF
ncbi:MAG TPA: ATPase, T2SS/T4P/T4SS family [Capsulimonadaceae bacterium]